MFHLKRCRSSPCHYCTASNSLQSWDKFLTAQFDFSNVSKILYSVFVHDHLRTMWSFQEFNLHSCFQNCSLLLQSSYNFDGYFLFRFTSHFKIKIQVSSRSVRIEIIDWNYCHVRFWILKFNPVRSWRFEIVSLSIHSGVLRILVCSGVRVWREC